MEKSDFPDWAQTHAGRALQAYLATNWETDSREISKHVRSYTWLAYPSPNSLGISSDVPFVNSREYPQSDRFLDEFVSKTISREKQAQVAIHSLLTDSRAETLWKNIEDIGLDQIKFTKIVIRCLTSHDTEKLSIKTNSEKRKYLNGIVEEARQLAGKLAGLRYQDITTTENKMLLYRLAQISENSKRPDRQLYFSSATDRNDGRNQAFESADTTPRANAEQKQRYNWIESALLPLSFELERLAAHIESDLQSGEFKQPVKSHFSFDGKKYPVPAPPLQQGHKTRNGERMYFLKTLGLMMRDVTGGPRHKIVAKAVSVIFHDLPEIDEKYVIDNAAPV